MTSFLKRSFHTTLTDDEVIIFDVLFDRSVPLRNLEGGKEFEYFFNYPSHRLEIVQLTDTLNKFINEGFMKTNIIAYEKLKKLCVYIELTEKGGKIWEKERTPNWENYIIDYQIRNEIKNKEELYIYSLSLIVAEKFLNTAHKSKLYKMKNPENKSISKIDGTKLGYIPWKKFSELYEIKTELSERVYINGHPGIDWDIYWHEIEWWRDVSELVTS
ncbi:MAG: hypothetical protein GY795_50725 [Desulfobacterales bacterium]|nr:hypothetical protein [Desulfobacterales bacterium]